jgi:hypothetical protein
VLLLLLGVVWALLWGLSSKRSLYVCDSGHERVQHCEEEALGVAAGAAAACSPGWGP